MNKGANNTDTRANKKIRFWLILVVILIAGSMLTLLAPDERTLGQGIKVVYVHVAFIWTGMLGFTLAGILGVLMLFMEKKTMHDLNLTLSWVSLACFSVGIALSLLASQVNWGGIYWQEPRMLSSLGFLAAATLVLIAKKLLPWYRARGALSAFLAFLLMWSILGIPLVLHPKSAIRESSAITIQLTFLAMFVLSSLAAACLVWYFLSRE